MRVRSALIALVLFVALAVAVGATGCSRPSRGGSGSVPASGPTDVTQTIETTASGETAGVDESTSGQGSSAVPADADAIIRELDAIERELGGMDLPSETDFDSLEGDIR